MGQGNEQKVRPGDRVRINSHTWNHVIDLVKRGKLEAFRSGNFEAVTNEISPRNTVLVKNNVAGVTSFRVLRLSSPILPPADVKFDINRRPACQGNYPENPESFIGLTQEPIDTGEIGKVAISGLTFAYVKMLDGGHEWANPVLNETAFLESTDCNGQARIIHTTVVGGEASDVVLAWVYLIGYPVCVDGIEGFHARLLTGSFGGPWTVQPIARDTSEWVDVGEPVDDVYAKAWRNTYTPNPEAEDIVWVKRSEENSERYEFISHPRFACGIGHDPATDEYSVNVEQLAGEGLTFNDDGEGCEQLNINVGCGLAILDDELVLDITSIVGPGLQENATPPCNELMVKTGCGLEIDGDGAVAVNLTDAVFDGLYFDDTNCTMGVLTGCGLTYGPTNVPGEEGDAIVVDFDVLAGEHTLTGLIVQPSGSAPCPSLGIDLGAVDTTIENLVTDVSLTFVGGQVCVIMEKTPYTNHFNAAGLHINRTAGSPFEESGGCIDLCAALACCEAAELTIDAGSNVTGGEEDLEVNFTTEVAGGVGPYTYLWDFDDGGTSTLQNPTHVFTSPGVYNVTVTVTDDCGFTDSDNITITVTEASEPIESPCCPGNFIPSNLIATFSNGTGDAACLSGLMLPLIYDGGAGGWTSGCLSNLGGCGWKGNTVTLVCQSPPGFFSLSIAPSPCPPDIPDCGGNSNGFSGSDTDFAFTCDPFVATFTLNLTVNCGALSGTVDVTVS